MWASSVDVTGPLVERLTKACAERDIHLAIGVNEREDDRPGTLYNTLLIVGPDGVLHRHRKLMPTMHERVFHGVGAGDDLDVVDLPGVGRVGGLICWENRMPLARWRVYQGGPQIWVAPTADDSEGWIASMRHIAIEAGAFVVSVPQYIPASAFPDDFPLPLPEDKPGRDVFGRGGACIVSPYGDVVVRTAYDGEGIVVADCDLREASPREALLRRRRPLRPGRRARPHLRPRRRHGRCVARRNSQSSTCVPTSKTRSRGRLKNRLALSAPRCSSVYRCSRAGCMPSRSPWLHRLPPDEVGDLVELERCPVDRRRPTAPRARRAPP